MTRMKTIVAILEDNDERTEAMRECLSRLVDPRDIQFFKSAPQMADWLREHLDRVRVISLDHDLDPVPGPDGKAIEAGDGRDVANYLATQRPACPVIIHTSNSDGASSMRFALEDAGWTVIRVLPLDGMAWISTRWWDSVVAILGMT